LSDFNQNLSPRHILIAVICSKFCGIPSNDIRADTCGQTDGRTDIKKVTGAICDYAVAPKKKKGNEKQEIIIKLKNGVRRHETGVREKG